MELTTEKRRKRNLRSKEWEATLLLIAQGVSACGAQNLNASHTKAKCPLKITHGSCCLQTLSP